MAPAALALLFASLPAHAGAPKPPKDLKEEWVAAGASSQTVLVQDAKGTSLLSLVDTAGTLSLVRVDAVSGLITWQTDVVPGVGWGSFDVRGDEILLEGTRLVDGAPQVASVSAASGQRAWTRPVDPGVRLAFGDSGGRALSGGCQLTVLGDDGHEVVTLHGVAIQQGLDSLCSASPRLLGEVAGRWVVEVPTPGDRWRLEAVGPKGEGWTADLGALLAAPEVDWRTGLFWSRSAEGLVFCRFNLATGQVAWKSAREVTTCQPVVRAVTGPLGAPAVLVQACDALTLIDPHDGATMWQVNDGTGDAVVDGEPFGLPEWVQPTETGRQLRWVDANGRPHGRATVEPEAYGVPVAEGVLTRSPTRVALVGRDGADLWALALGKPRWAFAGDLLVLAPELGELRLVVERATGEILGQFAGGEVIGWVPIPGSESQRLLFVQGQSLRALKVIVQP